mmetsp:Transcript_65785/g.129128  ORF Transcript_65785/g.129128 Transcript_65785/m.129128 type:complete len:155 (-) Transcript_65785:70-534(-)
MVRNLRQRGCELHGMLAHPSLESQTARFTSAGWDSPPPTPQTPETPLGGRSSPTAVTAAAAEAPSLPLASAKSTSAWDMLSVYSAPGFLCPAREKRRIEGLEFLDEIEEWQLLMKHYALCVASKDHQAGNVGNISQSLSMKPLFLRLSAALGGA